LPTQQFQKATAKEVWQESMNQIKYGSQGQHANTVTTIGQV
jgi:hypothetical protein